MTFFSFTARSMPWKNWSLTFFVSSPTVIGSAPWMRATIRLSFSSASIPGFFAWRSSCFRSALSIVAYRFTSPS